MITAQEVEYTRRLPQSVSSTCGVYLIFCLILLHAQKLPVFQTHNAILLLPIAVILMLWRLAFWQKIRISQIGIEEQTTFRTSAFPWAQVQDVRYKPGGYANAGLVSGKLILVSSTGKKITIRSNTDRFEDAVQAIGAQMADCGFDLRVIMQTAVARASFVHPHIEDIPEQVMLVVWLVGSIAYAVSVCRLLL